jgi:hypothetical protein
MLLHETGQRVEAHRLYEDAVVGLTARLGPTHTDTLNARHNLAVLLGEMGVEHLQLSRDTLVGVVRDFARAEADLQLLYQPSCDGQCGVDSGACGDGGCGDSGPRALASDHTVRSASCDVGGGSSGTVDGCGLVASARPASRMMRSTSTPPESGRGAAGISAESRRVDASVLGRIDTLGAQMSLADVETRLGNKVGCISL